MDSNYVAYWSAATLLRPSRRQQCVELLYGPTVDKFGNYIGQGRGIVDEVLLSRLRTQDTRRSPLVRLVQLTADSCRRRRHMRALQPCNPDQSILSTNVSYAFNTTRPASGMQELVDIFEMKCRGD